MIFRKSFQFRLRPTKKQTRLLLEQLGECRWLYSELSEQRKLAHEDLGTSLSKYQQNMLLLLMKSERASLAKAQRKDLMLQKTSQGSVWRKDNL